MNACMKIMAISATTLCGLLLLNGCSRIKGTSHEHKEHAHHSANWEFHEGRGVRLSAEGKEILLLELTTELEPGVSVEEATLRIPASALLTTARGDFVYVVNGNYFFRSPVIAGHRNDDFVEIRDGLFEGDIVVSHGVKQLWLIELQAINGGEACTDGH